MKNNPEISVILPFFNAEKSIEKAMQSIQHQSFNNFECLLINNASKDKGPELAARFCKSDPRFKLIHEPNKGVVRANNTGAAQARGQFLCRMDADDEAFPDRLLLQLKHLQENPKIGAVAGLVAYESKIELSDGYRRFVEWNNTLIEPGDLYLNRFIELPLVNPTLMWRRQTMDNFGLYREGPFPEDYEMILRWMEAGVRIGKVNRTVITWKDSRDRISRNDPRYSEESFYTIKSHYLHNWLKRKNPFHPEIMIWGASRISRKRASYLSKLGIQIKAYIDIKKTRKLDRELIYYEELPEAGNAFIIIYISQESARAEIRQFLQLKNYLEGRDFLFAS